MRKTIPFTGRLFEKMPTLQEFEQAADQNGFKKKPSLIKQELIEKYKQDQRRLRAERAKEGTPTPTLGGLVFDPKAAARQQKIEPSKKPITESPLSPISPSPVRVR